MKKIDLHIHTVSTSSDHPFEFSLVSLQKYVTDNALDAIAITNHNVFDREQYKLICQSVSVKVFPGIEVDLENGHILVIAENADVEDFNSRCALITEKNVGGNSISEKDFIQIFTDHKKYLYIPHYDKAPRLSLFATPNLRPHITCGEVSSAKKFLSQKKNSDELVPVLFGDIRISNPIVEPQDRQTYIDTEELTLSAIKYSLMDREKVSLSPEDGHAVFEVLGNGLKISTGLTVVLGKRSSGKSYTLDRLNEQFPNPKYIPQFKLLATDENTDQQKFEELLRTKGSSFSEEFMTPFKAVVDDVSNVSLSQDDKELDSYVKALLKAASEAERQDAFAKCHLFHETRFEEKSLDSLVELIEAVDRLIQNTEYKSLIERHVQRKSLLELGISLQWRYIEESELAMKSRFVNDIVASVQGELQVRSSNTSVPDIDLYRIMMNKVKVQKFEGIVRAIKKPRVIKDRSVYSYRVVAKAQEYTGAMEMQRTSKSKMVFSDAFTCYSMPYAFLQKLKEKDTLPAAEYYKYFVNIKHEVLNQYGTNASGGERSEYNLLQELVDAAKSDVLILDEPESSFDNLFLKDGVNTLLKDLSKKIPVIIATHNNTIGASVHPDYLIYTQKEVLEDGSIKYHLYSGYPSSSELVDLEGNTLSRKDVMLDCLEAGEAAYKERRSSYEMLNN